MINYRRKVRFTSFGKMALFLSIFLLFSAQNTGNNLLFLMSSCFIAAVAFFTWISYNNLSDIKISIEMPDAIFAHQDVVLKCYLSDRRNTEHFSLAFSDDFCSVLDAGETAMLKSQIKVGSRGIYLMSDHFVFSFYPFGLCLVSLFIPEQEILVGPNPATRIPELVEQEIGGAVQKFQPGKEGEYWMQKHYEPGEDASLINWNISARSEHEWILTRALNYGLPEKLYFDFSGLEGEVFENCLEIVMGVLQKLKNAGSSAFIWAEQKNGQYNWLTVSDNYSELVHWLARISPQSKFPPPQGEYRGIKFSELLRLNG